MNDWEYDMWWDVVNGMEDEDYDDMDDWQGGRPINFYEIYKINRSYKIFSYVCRPKIPGIFIAKFLQSSIIKLSKQRRNPKMKSLKKFFNIESPYKFEWNDLRCFITVINVILIMTYGLSISWFGLAVAIVGIIKDLTKDRRINGLLMHLANAALNIYFLWILYR